MNLILSPFPLPAAAAISKSSFIKPAFKHLSGDTFPIFILTTSTPDSTIQSNSSCNAFLVWPNFPALYSFKSKNGLQFIMALKLSLTSISLVRGLMIGLLTIICSPSQFCASNWIPSILMLEQSTPCALCSGAYFTIILLPLITKLTWCLSAGRHSPPGCCVFQLLSLIYRVTALGLSFGPTNFSGRIISKTTSVSLMSTV